MIRTSTLQSFKAEGKKFAALTSYDSITAGIFDEAGIEVVLVGDSAADNVLGYETTLPITVEEMIPFGRAVARATKRSLVVVDMPFGSYEPSAEVALENAIKLMKQTGADAVKLEGGLRSVSQIEALTKAGIPVMGHIGFTPQSVNNLGGFKVQGRGEGSQALIEDALAVQAAGAFSVVLELVPADLAAEVTKLLEIPTIGIGAGNSTDGQILVWTDFAGLYPGKPRKFVKQFAQMRTDLLRAAEEYKSQVAEGTFPGPEHSHD
ncbi:MAG: 3-methyl-2-oxobutanoate hydroxymethyltransferase [Micrococcales bacterium]|nr:3-methyl-2-oxobutanoate hydroxymethyltransferase [Micrococcales bacterium]NBR60936.1 3-methyl-2-oxobutanoate hydroxymethyltransferase [Actinomycetota bacterium]NBR54511.1 3-methyl-2-oxobutanoate hydroxymethyltransferase [Micrococcales bacterium]NBT46914.1 3-methyl-2-oxobutanoate hydroxymethyltransferase [Actinomycetota bacterium]NBY43793.1 3-methyl-2-oxobutanoate hydroxymethyltransferase [Micrococcales bacterium]